MWFARNRSKMFAILLAGSLAAAVLLVLRSESTLYYLDETDYFGLAQRMYGGLGYVDELLLPTASRPPGYPLVMVPFVGLTHSVLFIKLLNVVLLGISLLLIRALVARETRLAAWLAGGVALAYPVWLYTASTLYPQTLCMTLLLGIVYVLTRADLTWSNITGAGVLFGALILTAPSFQMLGPLLAGYILVCDSRPWWRKALMAFIFAAATVATIGPWIVRNYEVFGKLIPVSTNGGINLLLGNSENTRSNSGVDVNLDHYISQTGHLNEVERSSAYGRFALDWVSSNPAEAALLYVRKLVNYFNFRAEPVTRVTGTSAWQDWIMFFTYYPMLLLAVARLMLVRLKPLSRAEWLLLTLYVANAFLAAIFFTRVRFRLPFDGLLAVLALTALGLVFERWEVGTPAERWARPVH
jgi:hypothetical protein